MKSLTVGGLLFFSLITVAHAQDFRTECGALEQASTRETVSCLLPELISSRFPELEKAKNESRIQVEWVKSAPFFLADDFYFKIAVAKNRHYTIQIHDQLLGSSIIKMQGALAHELVHVKDFETRVVIPAAEISTYERKTDQETMERGFSEGLELYREWLSTYPAKELATWLDKKFLTPTEIEGWRNLYSDSHPVH